MAEPYNLTNVTSATNLKDLVGAANQLTGYMFANLLLVVIWVVIFVGLKNYFTKNAVFTASFITAIASVLLFLLGWVSQTTLMMCIVILALSMVWLKIESS